MEIAEAFKILQVSIDSDKESIESKFKELSKKYHPDKGGDNKKMSELNSARELAIEFTSNKSLIKVIREIAKSDNIEIQKSITIEKEINVIYKRLQNRATNKLKSLKEILGYMGLLSGILTLVASKILPLFKLPDNSSLSLILLFCSVSFGVYFLMFNHKLKILEENISEFKDNLDDKEDLYNILSQIFKGHKETEIDRDQLYDLVNKWSNYENESRTKNSELLYYSTKVSPQRIYRLIGEKDFSKMIILKGEQAKFIEITENKKSNREFETKYKMS